METPLSITFRDIEASPALEARIQHEAEHLARRAPRLTRCDVVLEAPHRHKHQGMLWRVHIRLELPGGEVVVAHEGPRDHAHESAAVALRDAFRAAERQVERHREKQEGDVKAHIAPPSGRVTRLEPKADHGFITLDDGEEVYFHRHSVAGHAFDKLHIGAAVTLVLSEGDAGPQASLVRPLHQGPGA
jgi:cold shock CspA family protein/ribosome-associated translation inhibitor RaiA